MPPMESWLEYFARASFRRSADTAHDLKTPLNVAVLNLELLRMRLRKLAVDEDPKIDGYTRAIEVELRRLGRIFDAFFLLSVPPKNEAPPAAVDLGAIVAASGSAAGMPVRVDGAATVLAHEARIRQAVQLFFEGASKLFAPDDRTAAAAVDTHAVIVAITGRPLPADFELSKIFKFYYTDSDGNPDLSLAVARLISETYGGELNATEERDKVTLRLSFPLGAQ